MSNATAPIRLATENAPSPLPEFALRDIRRLREANKVSRPVFDSGAARATTGSLVESRVGQFDGVGRGGLVLPGPVHRPCPGSLGSPSRGTLVVGPLCLAKIA